jgi:hypothetical protein
MKHFISSPGELIHKKWKQSFNNVIGSNFF